MTLGIATRTGTGLIVPAVVLIGWQVASNAHVIDPLFLPPPLSIVVALKAMSADGTLWQNLAPSLMRVAEGYAIGCAIGLIIGLVLGGSELMRRLFTFQLELLRPIPPISLIPVTLLWFGIGSPSKIALIAFASFWSVALSTELGVREIPPILKSAAQVMEITGLPYYWEIVIRASLAKIVTGLRLSAAVSLIVLVASEMVASPNGIGFLIVDSERNFRPADMFAAIAVISLLGYVVNVALLAIERKLNPQLNLSRPS